MQDAEAILDSDDSLFTGQRSYTAISRKISDLVLKKKTPISWWLCFSVSLAIVLLLGVSIVYLFAFGVGIWGINIPVAWGFAIATFVWWIGIGHAGTLISAILLIFRQKWRTSINRFAEAMTLFAVACAGLYPILHLGRPWFFYWLVPYPATTGVWPQFRSPLIWDFFAIATYGTVSLMFWYIGLIPDLATVRDRAQSRYAQVIYGFLAMGWRGSARHWKRHQVAYLLLAGLATPLVVSVHSIVSFDFSVASLPGWHSTIFPPYFVAGAIYSGFAMVLTIAVPLRAVYRIDDYITVTHLDLAARILLASGLLVAYGYLVEHFMTWYSGSLFEEFMLHNRMFGPYGFYDWLVLFCNVAVAQLLWFRWVRRSPWTLFVISILINIGMWLERFVIVIVSLHRDYLPTSWGMYVPTFWDWATLIGTLGLFVFLFLLFIRVLPMISMSEVREFISESDGEINTEPDQPIAEETPSDDASDQVGLLAEFENADDLLEAANASYEAGYRKMDAYSSFPVQGLSDAIGFRNTSLPWIVFGGGVVGGLTGYGLATFCAAIAYPINVGGRPLNSWPAFIPVTFEVTILFASITAAVGMLWLNGLPRPHHPVFNIAQFDRASQDRFFLCIFTKDEQFAADHTRDFLKSFPAREVHDVRE